MKKIILVTNNHLVSNPRLVKEAISLYEAGFEIQVFYCQSLNEIVQFDKLIESNNPKIKFIPINIASLPLLHKIYYKIKISINKVLFDVLGWSLFLNNSFTYLSNYVYNRIKNEYADLIIGHNIAMLPTVVKYSKHTRTPFAFDIEDAYSLQNTKDLYKPDKYIHQLESRNLYKASYISFASPFYLEYYRKEYFLKNKLITILNTFPVMNFTVEQYFDRVDLNKISLYWYSQTVGLDRGLDDIIYALNNVEQNVFELHIRGKCDEKTKSTLLNLAQTEELRANIYFHELVDPEDLKLRTAEHDIGLALEQDNSINRDWCLTNKIFEYFSAGILIIASKTSAQFKLLNTHEDVCFLYESKNIEELVKVLNKLIGIKTQLGSLKNNSKALAQGSYNWDNTKVILNQTVKEFLN